MTCATRKDRFSTRASRTTLTQYTLLTSPTAPRSPTLTVKPSSTVHASATVPTHLDAQFTLVNIVPTVATSVPGHARALKSIYHVFACASIHARGVAALINISVTVTSSKTGSTLTCVAIHFVSTRPIDAGVRMTVVDIGLTVGSGVARGT